MALNTPTNSILLTVTTFLALGSHMMNIHSSVIALLPTYRTDIILRFLNLLLPVMLMSSAFNFRQLLLDQQVLMNPNLLPSPPSPSLSHDTPLFTLVGLLMNLRGIKHSCLSAMLYIDSIPPLYSYHDLLILVSVLCNSPT